MELREAFITFIQHIKTYLQVSQEQIQFIDQLLIHLNSKKSDLDVKQFIIDEIKKFNPNHKRTPSQPLNSKPPLIIKQNGLMGIQAFNQKPIRKISQQQQQQNEPLTIQTQRQPKSNNGTIINIVHYEFGKFLKRNEILNNIQLNMKQFYYDTETLHQIHNHTTEIQTAYGIRVSQDIHGSRQLKRKDSNLLFAGYNSKLMTDDQLIAIQNNFLMKKQIVKGRNTLAKNESPFLQEKQIFLI